jgi:hypothetical protein
MWLSHFPIYSSSPAFSIVYSHRVIDLDSQTIILQIQSSLGGYFVQLKKFAGDKHIHTCHSEGLSNILIDGGVHEFN